MNTTCVAKITAALILSPITLPFGRLWYDTPINAIDYAKFSSRSHDAAIRVYDEAEADVFSDVYWLFCWQR